jgi:flavin reductase (DIM6/NTAB) family NADH-FMN oxidoreductase RutF
MLDPGQPIDFTSHRQRRGGERVGRNFDEFPEALRRLPRGVSIITLGGKEPFGLTATSVSSLGRNPPTILVSVDKSISLSRRLLAGRRFGISVLAAGHDDLAERFAGGARISEDSRRSDVWLSPESGVPLLADAVAAFDCELDDTMECHGHAIVVGLVRGVIAPGKCSALVYWRGAYDHLGWTEDEVSRAIGVTPVGDESDEN